MMKIEILDTYVSNLTKLEALQFVDDCITTSSTPQIVVALNPEKIYALRDNVELRIFFKKASLVIADGVGICLAARILKGIRLPRITGVDFMLDIVELAEKKGYKIFLLGASEEVSLQAMKKIKEDYPKINIAGRANGYVGLKNDHLVDQINDSGADILFVALGSPRQELWMQANMCELKPKIIQGIGGTLDVVSGKVERAPYFLRKIGLEWLSRLCFQPTRIFRQTTLVRFSLEVIRKKIKNLGKKNR